MRNVLIVEDHEQTLKELKQIVEEQEVRVFTAVDTKEAYKIACEHTIDLFLLDIILKGDKHEEASGNRFALAIREMPKYSRALIVIITSLRDPGFMYYEQIHCFRYIMKPYDIEVVRTVVEEAIALPRLEYKKNDHVMLRSNSITFSCQKSKIVFIDKANQIMKLHSVTGVCEVAYKSLKSMLEELASDDFVQCSRFNIVNMNYIYAIDKMNNYITLENGFGTIPIGRAMKKGFLKRYEEWCKDYI